MNTFSVSVDAQIKRFRDFSSLQALYSSVLIPLVADYVILREKKGVFVSSLDRIDKALLILPLLPIADLASTLFSLQFGGEEIGILGRPILQSYGAQGLVPLAASASVIFFVFMLTVIHVKKRLTVEQNFRWTHYALAFPVYWFFMLQGIYVSTVVMNFLVPLAFPLNATTIMRVLLVCTYFACVGILTKPQTLRFPRF